MRLPCHRVPVLGIALIMLAPDAGAGLVGVSQLRTLTTSSGAKLGAATLADADFDSAPDFSKFDEQVSSSSVLTSGAVFMIGTGAASQFSSLGPNVISVYGDASSNLALAAAQNSSASGSGKSFFQYEFVVPTPHSFSFSGVLDTQASVTGGATLPSLFNSVLLENLTESSVLFQSLTTDEAFSVSGLLSPGTYRLTAVAEVIGSTAASRTLARTASGQSSFDFDFRAQNLPEAGTGLAAGILGVLGGWGVLIRRRRAGNLG